MILKDFIISRSVTETGRLWHKKVKKRLTHVGAYNIIKQYDMR